MNNTIKQAAVIFTVLLLIAIAAGNIGCDRHCRVPGWAVNFAGRTGQVEVGGPLAGIECHHSSPLPVRISFYEPVANSLDLSIGYWERDRSRPLVAVLAIDDHPIDMQDSAWIYTQTPGFVRFEAVVDSVDLSCTYRFAETTSAVEWELVFHNRTDRPRQIRIDQKIALLLRTCHTFAVKFPTCITKTGNLTLACFADAETDSASLWITQLDGFPEAIAIDTLATELADAVPHTRFSNAFALAARSQKKQSLLIGHASMREAEQQAAISRSQWQKDCRRYTNRLERAAARAAAFSPADSALQQTAHWSLAVLEANRHHIDGKRLPMPCPAEYNFFFTHDLLLTHLGVVWVDPQMVAGDLLALADLSQPEPLLLHAYYWKDGRFARETCGSDNWNPLWLAELLGKYLQRSGDLATVSRLYPLMSAGVDLILRERLADGLIISQQPDWWDIGSNTGARAYLTLMIIRALRRRAFLAAELELRPEEQVTSLQLADQLEENLEKRLWDEQEDYLLNELENGCVDRHLYAGSLLAVVWHLLEPQKQAKLLQTATNRLVDRQLGLRIVMPADFHELIDLYGFIGMEAGEPYTYINGGIWPQGIAWYALAQIEQDQPDSALQTVKKYLTLAGIRKSPMGQPSFFEYRMADDQRSDYGAIDKPTFLWTGGWFLETLFHLCGFRETEGAIALSPALPAEWHELHTETWIRGNRVAVDISGDGDAFAELQVNGQECHSAVLLPGTRRVKAIRGSVNTPILMQSTCKIEVVKYEPATPALQIDLRGWSGQTVELQIASPWPIIRSETDRYQVIGQLPHESIRLEMPSDRITLKIAFDRRASH